MDGKFKKNDKDQFIVDIDDFEDSLNEILYTMLLVDYLSSKMYAENLLKDKFK